VFAILASYLISRTLVPVLVTWLYRDVKLHGEHTDESTALLDPAVHPVPALLKKALTVSGNGYRPCSRAVFEHRQPFAIFFLAFCVGSWLLVKRSARTFSQAVDTGSFTAPARATARASRKPSVSPARSTASIHREIPPASFAASRQHRHSQFLDQLSTTPAASSARRRGHFGFAQARHAPRRITSGGCARVLSREFPGVMIIFLPADIVSSTLNFSLRRRSSWQIVGADQ